MRIHPARDRQIVEEQILPFMREVSGHRYPDLEFDESRSFDWILGFHTPDGSKELHWYEPGLLIALKKEKFSVTYATVWRVSVFSIQAVLTEEIIQSILENREEPSCLLSTQALSEVFLGYQYRLLSKRR